MDWFGSSQGIPTVCDLCNLNTHDIMYCPQREYFPLTWQLHISMRNNFQRPGRNSYSNFHNPSWPEHQNPMWAPSHQPFEQPLAPAKADWEIAIENMAKSFESSHRTIQDTQASLDNLVKQVGQRMHQWDEHEEDEFPCQQIDGPQSSQEWFVIQTPQCAASYDYMQEDIRIEEPPGEDYSPMEENGNLEISPESVPSYVHRPHIPFHDVAKQPTKLQDCIDTDGLDRNAYTKSASGKSHGQIVHTIILDTRQDTDINVFEVVTVPAPYNLGSAGL